MFDNNNFMTKFVDGLIVFAIVFAYLWVMWQIVKFYIYVFKLIFKGIKFLFGRLKNIFVFLGNLKRRNNPLSNNWTHKHSI